MSEHWPEIKLDPALRASVVKKLVENIPTLFCSLLKDPDMIVAIAVPSHNVEALEAKLREICESMKSNIPTVSEANLKDLGVDSVEGILRRDDFIGVLSIDGSKIAFGQRGVPGLLGHGLIKEKYPFGEDVYHFEYARPILHLHGKLEYETNLFSPLSLEDMRVVRDVLRLLGISADTIFKWYDEAGGLKGVWVVEKQE